MLNCDCYIAILETIQLYAKKSSGSFENVIYKMCLQIIYKFNMYTQDSTLNNLQWLICNKTKPNLRIIVTSDIVSKENACLFSEKRCESNEFSSFPIAFE